MLAAHFLSKLQALECPHLGRPAEPLKNLKRTLCQRWKMWFTAKLPRPSCDSHHPRGEARAARPGDPSWSISSIVCPARSMAGRLRAGSNAWTSSASISWLCFNTKQQRKIIDKWLCVQPQQLFLSFDLGWIILQTVAGSLWNTVWCITLEHSHFRITLEHKMIHIIKTMPTTQTWDLLTGTILWKPGAFQSENRTKKKPPMRNRVVRTMLPSATPATQHQGRCYQVPRLPQKMKCHACHRKWKSMSKTATHATQHGRRCRHACHAKCTLPILIVTNGSIL